MSTNQKQSVGQLSVEEFMAMILGMIRKEVGEGLVEVEKRLDSLVQTLILEELTPQLSELNLRLAELEALFTPKIEMCHLRQVETDATFRRIKAAI